MPRLKPILLLAFALTLAACDSDDPAPEQGFGFTEVTLTITSTLGTTQTVTETIGDNTLAPTVEFLPNTSYAVVATFRNADAEDDPNSPQKIIESNVDTYQVIYDVTGDTEGLVTVRYTDKESDYDFEQEGDDLAVGLTATIETLDPATTQNGFLSVDVYEYEAGTKRTGTPGLTSSGSARFPLVIPIL